MSRPRGAIRAEFTAARGDTNEVLAHLVWRGRPFNGAMRRAWERALREAAARPAPLARKGTRRRRRRR